MGRGPATVPPGPAQDQLLLGAVLRLLRRLPTPVALNAIERLYDPRLAHLIDRARTAHLPILAFELRVAPEEVFRSHALQDGDVEEHVLEADLL